LKEYSLSQEWLKPIMLSVNHEWLEEIKPKGLAKSDYEPKEYSVQSGVTCVKTTQRNNQEWLDAQRVLK